MESIKSEQVFGNATATLGEAPKHTSEGHESCAYYVDPDGNMLCPHGELATGAFYSEDFVNEMRRTAHQFISSVRADNHPITGSTKTLLHKMIELTR